MELDYKQIQQQTKKDFKLPIQNNQNRFASEPVHEPECTKINKRRVSFEKLVYDLGLEECGMDEDSAERALDETLKLTDLENIKTLCNKIKNEGFEPTVRIKTLSTIIDNFQKQESFDTLKFLVDEKCTLKYSDDDNTGINEVLTSYFKQLTMTTSEDEPIIGGSSIIQIDSLKESNLLKESKKWENNNFNDSIIDMDENKLVSESLIKQSLNGDKTKIQPSQRNIRVKRLNILRIK